MEGYARLMEWLRQFMRTFPICQKMRFMIERAGKQQNFTEEELWYLILSIFMAKRQLKAKKLNQGNLGNLNTQNIFLSQKGQIKIASYLSWPGHLQSEIKQSFNDECQYIAPQDLVKISIGGNYCKGTNSSQLFSIGLTLLSASLLKDSQQLYNRERKKFDFSQFMIRVELLRSCDRYSDLLKVIIELMCSIDPKERLKQNEIDEIILKYENSIRHKKKFTPYPLSGRIQKKLRFYRSQKENSIDQFFKQNPNLIEILSDSNHISQQCDLKRNSLRLTQVILGEGNFDPQDPDISDSQSLYSSVDQFQLRKTHSDTNSDKSLQRYQQINANSQSDCLDDMEYLNLINFAKQIIIQKPILLDLKRKSDDIQDESTPKSTPQNLSLYQEKQKMLSMTLQLPKQNFHHSERKNISKTANFTINQSQSNVNRNLLKVKSIQAPNSHEKISKDDIKKTQNSNRTIYIVLEDQNIRNSDKMNNSQKGQKQLKFNREIIYPEKIPQNQIQWSQLQIIEIQEKQQEKNKP